LVVRGAGGAFFLPNRLWLWLADELHLIELAVDSHEVLWGAIAKSAFWHFEQGVLRVGHRAMGREGAISG
jgi:hypothetical protein